MLSPSSLKIWLSTYIEHRATWSNLKTKKKGENDTFSDSEDEESQSVADTDNNELQHDESGQGIYSESEDGLGDGGLSSQQDSDMYVDMAIMDPGDFKQGSSSSSALALNHGRKDQSEKTRKRKNTDNVQSSSTNVKKSRLWEVYNENLSKEEVDKALIKTANSISGQLKRGNQQGDWGEKEVNDEDSLFFRSLVPRFKRLCGSQKGMLRIEIEKLMYEAESSQHQMFSYRHQLAYSASHHHSKQSVPGQRPSTSQPLNNFQQRSMHQAQSYYVLDERQQVHSPPGQPSRNFDFTPQNNFEQPMRSILQSWAYQMPYVRQDDHRPKGQVPSGQQFVASFTRNQSSHLSPTEIQDQLQDQESSCASSPTPHSETDERAYTQLS